MGQNPVLRAVWQLHVDVLEFREGILHKGFCDVLDESFCNKHKRSSVIFSARPQCKKGSPAFHGVRDGDVHMIYSIFTSFSQTHAKVWHSYNNTWRREQRGNQDSFCDCAAVSVKALKNCRIVPLF